MPPLSPSQYRRQTDQNLDVPLNPIRYDNSGRVNADLENLIDRSVGAGDVLEQEFRDVGPAFWRNYNRYGGLADDAYEGLLTGEGGYSPEEAAQIGDYDFLRGLEYGPGEYNDLFLTADEQGGIAGNAWGVMDRFNPEAVRGQVRDFRDRGREALTEGGGRMRDFLSNAQLGVDPGAASRIRGSISRAGNDSALNEAALRLAPGFLDKFQMSDEEVGDIADLGARAASARYDSAYDDIARRAGASGMMAPAALATLRSDMDRKSNIDAADAATSAKLQGKGLQRDLLGRGEDMRIGAEQFIADANLARGLDLGRLALSAEEGLEDRRYRGESERLGAGMGMEDSLLGRRLGHETNVGGMGTDVERYVNDAGTGLYQWADDSSSGRNQFLGSNRQGAAGAGQQARRDFGFGVSDRRSGRAGQVADTRLGQEQAGRDYLERQGQFSGGMYQDAANRRADTAVGMTNAQLGGSADRRQRRGAGFWERTLLG